MSGRGEAAFPPFGGLPVVRTGLAAPPAERDVTPDWKPEKRTKAKRAKSDKGWCEARADHRCKGRADHTHHRKMRSQGGDNTRDNLLNVCSVCHHEIHANPDRAYRHGWLVPSWGIPAFVAVRRLECPVCDDLGCEFCPGPPREAA